ncbi:Crp/Fnr family transcriptional regulator [Lujinxingia vulgaris]|uniref:Crp/Fnr family transcriptional regulator n=2 Tax=Lujinxingia vulgaris TaxID=2600176 RepID=A0A5C6XFX6_9DELT|nr:Crp/Fnr family transcriptional regulator [Lujinxingia vulgaris]
MVLFREGEEGNRMYVIKSGSVRLTKRIHDTEVVVEDLGAGEFCGELAMLGEPRRPVSAVVTDDASVIQVDTEQFEEMIKGNSDIALRMLKKLTQRLTQAQYRVSNLVLRTNKARVLHQLRAETQRVKRVEGAGESAPIPANLADVLALEIGEVKQILNELVRDELILIDRRGYFEILDGEAYDRYLRYLELQDRFAFH